MTVRAGQVYQWRTTDVDPKSRMCRVVSVMKTHALLRNLDTGETLKVQPAEYLETNWQLIEEAPLTIKYSMVDERTGKTVGIIEMLP